MTWVTATTATGTRCMAAPYEPAQVLYSSTAGPTFDQPSTARLRFLEECLEYGSRLAVLEEAPHKRKFTAADVERLVVSRRVPPYRRGGFLLPRDIRGMRK